MTVKKLPVNNKPKDKTTEVEIKSVVKPSVKTAAKAAPKSADKPITKAAVKSTKPTVDSAIAVAEEPKKAAAKLLVKPETKSVIEQPALIEKTIIEPPPQVQPIPVTNTVEKVVPPVSKSVGAQTRNFFKAARQRISAIFN